MTETTDTASVPLQEIAESLNGWEELALTRMFGFTLDELETQGTISARALMFVELKRGGAKDKDAHRTVMDLTVSELIARYPELDEKDDPGAGLDEDGPGEA